MGKFPHHHQNFADEFGIKRAGRLVKQQEIRAHRKRSRDADALLLSTRQFRRKSIALVAQPNLREQCQRLIANLGLWPSLHLNRRFHQILQHRQMRPQRKMLEHHADARPDLRQVAIAHDDPGVVDADPLPIQIDLPGVRPLKPVDAA